MEIKLAYKASTTLHVHQRPSLRRTANDQAIMMLNLLKWSLWKDTITHYCVSLDVQLFKIINSSSYQKYMHEVGEMEDLNLFSMLINFTPHSLNLLK